MRKELPPILITGGTGYIGRRLVHILVGRGHSVRVLARSRSISKVPAGATPLDGNALDSHSVASALRKGDTLVHLVGTRNPAPAKADEFRAIDLASIQASVIAGREAGISHLVYLSVAQPAPVMSAYVEVRAEGERLIRQSGLTATILRPWYVLGPGHWWPVILLPFYAVAQHIPAWREPAQRLGLVSIRTMVTALISAIEYPTQPGTIAVLDVPAIRKVRGNLNS
jgi:uncharacterized protein YbjT (DUF2867 family)